MQKAIVDMLENACSAARSAVLALSNDYGIDHAERCQMYGLVVAGACIMAYSMDGELSGRGQATVRDAEDYIAAALGSVRREFNE